MGQVRVHSEQNGFVGAVSGMSLADIIQVKGGNRYSGCLIVEHGGNTGVVYFRDGEVVHAEQGSQLGEDAFYAIMGWVGGTFRSEPKVSTTSRTIDKSISFLVLEAVRRIDEARNSGMVEPSAQGRVAKGGTGVSEISTRFSTIPDIEKALVMTKDGAIIDDTSYQAEVLGANGLFLALFAGQIGAQFGIGDFKSATVQGSERHLFLFDSKRHHLCIAAKGSANINSLDSEIRRVLAQK